MSVVRRPRRAQVQLSGAILADVAGALVLRAAEGFEHPVVVLVAFVLWAITIGLLASALRVLPVGAAYPLFLGLTCAGVYLGGLLFHGEAVPTGAVLGLALIVGGVVLVVRQPRA